MSNAAPIQTFKSKFEWNVPRSAFDTPFGSRQFIKSQEFRACPDSKVSWELRVYPRGDSDYNNDSISLYLARLGALIWNPNEPVKVNNRVGFITSDGTEANVKVWDQTFPKDARPFPEWGWMEFISRAELLDPTGNFFRDDQLTIFCDLEVYWIPEVLVPECTLSSNWSKILDSGDFSDVILAVGGEELKAHKLVLSAGSPVFAAMFTHNMKESQSGRVEIEEFDVITVKALLKYLYSGVVENLEAIAEEVLPAADYYGVERLKLLCEREICKHLTLTVENVMDKLRWAGLYNATKLKARALRFVQANAGEVLKQDSFWELAKSDQDLLRGAFSTEELANNEHDCDGPQVKRRRLN